MFTNILLVDDDELVRRTLLFSLKQMPYNIHTTNRATKAIEILKEEEFDIVLTDVCMPEMTGIELLEHIKKEYPNTQVIVMTAQATINDAVKAIHKGALNYLQKPINPQELNGILKRVTKERNLEKEVLHLRAEVSKQYSHQNIIGNTEAIRKCFDLASTVSDTDAIVLLSGNTGTGKELFARSIHYNSKRRNFPFIAINCASLPSNLLETELFGHEKGSFTGAIKQHLGKFEQAAKGTLFLDEIGEMEFTVQAKLLRILESGEYQRVGGSKTLHNQARIIVATNRNLKEMVVLKKFREDLFYRLNIFEIVLPDLRDRKDDIPLLVQHFILKYNHQHLRMVQEIAPDALQLLMNYDWPGNIRELEHCIERAILLSKGTTIYSTQFPSEIQNQTSTIPSQNLQTSSLVDNLQEYERKLITIALKDNHWIQAKAAKQLHISRASLHQRIKRLGIQIPRR